ncbi:UDP-glucuronosyltransferase 1-1, partial [Anas platyrhynchos]
LLLSVLGLAAGGKLLVVPVDGSHWLSMREVLDSLKEKGHEVVVVAPEVNLYIKPSKSFVMKTYPIPFTQEELDRGFHEFTQDTLKEGSFLERFVRIYQRFEKNSALLLSTCEHLLYNKELMRYLEESKFDAVFTDPVIPCGPIVAEHLSVPSVYFLRGIPCGLDFEATQCPNPPSYVPRVFTEHTDHMNFLQRMAPVPASHLQVTVTLVLLLSVLGLAAGGKVLALPVGGSHWLSMREVLEGLKAKGHEVVVAAPEINLHIKPTDNFTMKMYPVPFTQEEMDKDFHAFLKGGFEEGSFLERFVRTYQRMKRLSDFAFISCEHLLYNKELMRYLEESKFDVVFTDPVIPCGPIVAEHLSVPSVYFLRGIPCGLDFEATQCPNPPSYVPRVFTEHTDHMSFLQRVKNLVFDVQNFFLCDFMYKPYSKLASEFLQRDMTVLDLLRKASVWLLRLDFVLDYPRPLMPNIVLIGGVNCAHKELPQV